MFTVNETPSKKYFPFFMITSFIRENFEAFDRILEPELVLLRKFKPALKFYISSFMYYKTFIFYNFHLFLFL